MTKEHIPQVAGIEKQSFSLPWTEEAFEESLSYEHAIFLEAFDRDKAKVAGYIGMYKVFNEGEIMNVAVAPEYRGRGIGAMLMQAVKEQASERDIHTLLLEVRESNSTAIGLYERQGFERIGKRKRFYERPVEDAIVMCLKLLPL